MTVNEAWQSRCDCRRRRTWPCSALHNLNTAAWPGRPRTCWSRRWRWSTGCGGTWRPRGPSTGWSRRGRFLGATGSSAPAGTAGSAPAAEGDEAGGAGAPRPLLGGAAARERGQAGPAGAGARIRRPARGATAPGGPVHFRPEEFSNGPGGCISPGREAPRGNRKRNPIVRRGSHQAVGADRAGGAPGTSGCRRWGEPEPCTQRIARGLASAAPLPRARPQAGPALRANDAALFRHLAATPPDVGLVPKSVPKSPRAGPGHRGTGGDVGPTPPERAGRRGTGRGELIGPWSGVHLSPLAPLPPERRRPTRAPGRGVFASIGGNPNGNVAGKPALAA